jgi:ABC-type sugar transport system substrate-binding protein
VLAAAFAVGIGTYSSAGATTEPPISEPSITETSVPQETVQLDEAPGADGADVVLLTVTEECEYCALHLESFREAVEAAGVNLDVKINDFDAATQATQVEQALSQNPDLIVLWPADASALVPSMRRIEEAGVPLIVTNSAPDAEFADLWLTFTGPDDYGNGVSAARAMIQGFEERGIGDSGTVFVVTGVPGTPPQIQRLAGFTETLAEEAPGIEVVDDQPGNWDQTQATDAAAALFTQHPDVDGVYAQADNMLAGVIAAAQRSGIDPASLVLVGSNCSIEGVTAIEEGTQYASVLQSPIDDGLYAANAAVALLEGESVAPVQYLPNPVITADNVEECFDAVGR